MDFFRIDGLTKSLTTDPTRRGVLGLLIATAIGDLAGLVGLGGAGAKDHRKKRRRRQRKQRRRDQEHSQHEQPAPVPDPVPDPIPDLCVPLTPVFEQPPAACSSSDECCDKGTCCTFDDGPGGLISGCYDLLTHTTACGVSCETVVNCLNFEPERLCVNGECVEP